MSKPHIKYRVYIDNLGNRWMVTQMKFQDTSRKYWLCECMDSQKSFREDTISNVLINLKNQ